jgi:hypothetical protein
MAYLYRKDRSPFWQVAYFSVYHKELQRWLEFPGEASMKEEVWHPCEEIPQ